MRFELLAEPVRAEEIASERAVDYMSLLLSAEAADLRARVGAMDMVNAAPTTPTLDELRDALSKALERF
jgi:hypothetical protein